MFGQTQQELDKLDKCISKYIEDYPPIDLLKDKLSLNFGACYRGFGRLSIGFNFHGEFVWPQDPFFLVLNVNLKIFLMKFMKKTTKMNGKIVKTPVRVDYLFWKSITNGGEYNLVSEEKT